MKITQTPNYDSRYERTRMGVALSIVSYVGVFSSERAKVQIDVSPTLEFLMYQYEQALVILKIFYYRRSMFCISIIIWNFDLILSEYCKTKPDEQSDRQA